MNESRPSGSGGQDPVSFTRINQWLIVGFATLLIVALVVRTAVGGYPLNTPGYDGGVYYGSAALLLRGVVAYHGYVFLQPPGSTVLLTPFAALGAAMSSSVGLLAAHYFVIAVAAANVILVGVLLRRRSPWALAVGLAVAAFYGDAVVADGTVLLEPLLALAVLIALVLVFRDERMISSSGAWLGAGVALGLGTSIKLWGGLVFLVLLVPALRCGSRVAGRYVVGFLGAAAVMCGPFFALAPGSFWREVVADQATRTSSGGASLLARVSNLVDAYSLSGRHHLSVELVLVALVLLAVFAVALSVLGRVMRSPSDQRRRSSGLSDLDLVALTSLILIVLSFLVAHQYYAHYGGFAAPFVALVLSTATVVALGRWRAITVVLVALVVVVLCVSAFTHLATRQSAADVPQALARTIPVDACVTAWNPAAVILADRFSAGRGNCPVVLDVYGTELDEDNGFGQSIVDQKSARVQGQILTWLRHSSAVVLNWSPGRTRDLGTMVKRYLEREFPVEHRFDGWYVFLRSP